MKKVFIALLSVLAVVSCGKEDVVEPEVFDILAEVGDLPNSAGTIDVQISTDYTDFEVVMATSESWVTFVETKSSLPVEEKVLTFSYTANPAMSVRQEAAKIVAGGLTLGEIVFTQKAGLPCVFKAPELDKLPYIKGSQEIKISYDYPEVTVEVDADWLKVEAAPEAKGEVDVVEHSYLLSYETALTREERTAKVTFKAGEEVVGQFDVVQSAFGGALILEKVYSRYSNGTNAWCSFIPGIANRTMASDGKYVYLQSSEATAKIYAIEIASLLKGDETPVYKALSTANMGGGTHAVSALRCIPNEAGDPVLIATNLAVDDSQNFNIYAYSNGTDKDPVLFHAYRFDGVANLKDWRRYGDRISVSGTWQKGSIWAPSQSATKVMVFHIENGATDSGHREYCWFDGMPGALSEATLYPGAADAPREVLLTEASSAGFWTPNTSGATHAGGFWPKWDKVKAVNSMKGAFSFQFFTFNNTKLIAYVQLSDNTHCNLVVVEDKGSLEASLAGEKMWTIPLYEGEKSSCPAGNTYGDCAVVDIDGKPHIVAMMQGGGLSVDRCSLILYDAAGMCMYPLHFF